MCVHIIFLLRHELRYFVRTEIFANNQFNILSFYVIFTRTSSVSLSLFIFMSFSKNVSSLVGP